MATRTPTKREFEQGFPDPDPEVDAATAEIAAYLRGEGIYVVDRREIETALDGNYDTKAKRKPYAGISKPKIVGKLPEDLADRHLRLKDRYPHAVRVVDALVGELAEKQQWGRDEAIVRPTVLVGGAGSGKSSLLRDFASMIIGTDHAAIGVGGAGDDSFIFGTSSRYSSAEPSVPIAMLASSKFANPTLVIDEIEKTGASSHNGNLHDRLLPFLEQNESRQIHCEFFKVKVDCSRINWLFTANSLAGIPAPLLSRLRVLRMPQPQPQHLSRILQSLAYEIAADLDVDPAFFTGSNGISQEEIEMISEHVVRRDGSLDLRGVKKAARVALLSREMPRC